MNQRNLLLLLLLAPFFCSLSSAITCHAGSRGYIKGELTELFVPEECDAGMEYCVESFLPSFDEVTANCQRLGTDARILEVCKSGKEQRRNGVTLRCCTEDLCNDKGLSRNGLNETSASGM